MIDVNSIYFDYDKFNIRRDAALELDKVVAIMEKYPKLIVESGSHTDSRGPDRYNMVLSDKRAKSTVDYIISRGISPERITGKGYGETQLTNRCSNGVRCSEEEHQLNRRTEFVIVNPEVIN
jgi:outer membrane protein OmpA-like peptidoglycan-associated protein